MKERIDTNPLIYARIGGVLYLINIACGMFGELFVRAHLVVAGNAAATAHNIMRSELLFRSSIAGDLIMHITDVPMAIIFYFLLRPVSRNLSALSALLGMLQTAVLCANKLNLLTVLLLLGGSNYLKAFSQSQLESLASLALAQHELGFGVGLIFFGVSCIVAGYLMFKSGYFPRTLGVMQTIAGVSYLINSFAGILFPSLADKMFRAILLPAFIGELATCLWLIVKGINVPVWRKRLAINAAD